MTTKKNQSTANKTTENRNEDDKVRAEKKKAQSQENDTSSDVQDLNKDSARVEEALGDTARSIPEHEQEEDYGDDSIPVVYSDSTAFIDAYAQVMDTSRSGFVPKEVENRLLRFANTPIAELTLNKGVEEVLDEALSIYGNFDKRVSFGENVMNGVGTMHRIQEGRFFIRLRELVDGFHGKRQWKQWLATNLPHKNYRVVRQYIQLAETPNIDRYAPLGKELLCNLVATLKSAHMLQGDDPVGGFLSNHGITYDPEADQGPEHLEFMRSIRVAMNYQKIMDAGLHESVSKELVEQYVDLGKAVNKSLVKELATARELGTEPSEQMEAILDNQGRLQGLKSPGQERDYAKKAFERFSELADQVTLDSAKIEGLTVDQINELVEKLEALAERLEEAREQEGEEEEEAAPLESAEPSEPGQETDQPDPGGDDEGTDSDASGSPSS